MCIDLNVLQFTWYAEHIEYIPCILSIDIFKTVIISVPLFHPFFLSVFYSAWPLGAKFTLSIFTQHPLPSPNPTQSFLRSESFLELLPFTLFKKGHKSQVLWEDGFFCTLLESLSMLSFFCPQDTGKLSDYLFATYHLLFPR